LYDGAELRRIDVGRLRMTLDEATGLAAAWLPRPDSENPALDASLGIQDHFVICGRWGAIGVMCVIRRAAIGVLLGGVGVLALTLAGCGDKYQRTSVTDACRLLDRSLVAQLTGGGRGYGARRGPGYWTCGWRSGEGVTLDLGIQVFTSRRYGDDVRTARRAYGEFSRPGGYAPIKNIDGTACWHEGAARIEVLLDRYDVVARITYSGRRPAAREHVKSAEIARLLAENLVKHL
jgi:hypothetical protein